MATADTGTPVVSISILRIYGIRFAPDCGPFPAWKSTWELIDRTPWRRRGRNLRKKRAAFILQLDCVCVAIDPRADYVLVLFFPGPRSVPGSRQTSGYVFYGRPNGLLIPSALLFHVTPGSCRTPRVIAFGGRTTDRLQSAGAPHHSDESMGNYSFPFWLPRRKRSATANPPLPDQFHLSEALPGSWRPRGRGRFPGRKRLIFNRIEFPYRQHPADFSGFAASEPSFGVRPSPPEAVSMPRRKRGFIRARNSGTTAALRETAESTRLSGHRRSSHPDRFPL